MTLSRAWWPPWDVCLGDGVLSPLQGQGALSSLYTERLGVWLRSICESRLGAWAPWFCHVGLLGQLHS